MDIGPEHDADIDEREDADFLNEVVMALDVRGRGNVGCCYYVAKDEKLLLLPDVQCGGLEVVDACAAYSDELDLLLVDHHQ